MTSPVGLTFVFSFFCNSWSYFSTEQLLKLYSGLIVTYLQCYLILGCLSSTFLQDRVQSKTVNLINLHSLTSQFEPLSLLCHFFPLPFFTYVTLAFPLKSWLFACLPLWIDHPAPNRPLCPKCVVWFLATHGLATLMPFFFPPLDFGTLCSLVFFPKRLVSSLKEEMTFLFSISPDLTMAPLPVIGLLTLLYYKVSMSLAQKNISYHLKISASHIGTGYRVCSIIIFYLIFNKLSR